MQVIDALGPGLLELLSHSALATSFVAPSPPSTREILSGNAVMQKFFKRNWEGDFSYPYASVMLISKGRVSSGLTEKTH